MSVTESYKEAKKSMSLEIGMRIHYARRVMGITQGELSDLTAITGDGMRISRTSINGYESGKGGIPGGLAIFRLCQALKMSPSRLMTGSDIVLWANDVSESYTEKYLTKKGAP